MSEDRGIQLLQSQYLLEIERAKLDRETNGDYTADGLRHLKEAGTIQIKLAASTSGEVSARHMRMSRELLQDVLRHMQRLGFTEEKIKEKSAGTRDAAPAKQEDAPQKPAKERKKSENGELDGFCVEDYIVKPGAVSLEDARNGNPTVVDDLREAVYDDFLELFPKIEGYTGLNVCHRLLYGPPGSGKTYICKGLSTYLNQMYPDGESCFFLLSCSEIKSKFVGTAEHRIREVFKAAEEYVFSIICIDEVDALCPPRTEDQKLNYTTTLLELIDGVQGKSEAMVILATNHPENVDAALISRIGNRDFVDYPSHVALEEFLRNNKSISAGLGENQAERERIVQKIAAIAEEKHFSFRNMNVLSDEIMKRMKNKLREKYKEGNKEITSFLPLTENELMEAVKRVNTDYNQKEYANLLAYRDNHA